MFPKECRFHSHSDESFRSFLRSTNRTTYSRHQKKYPNRRGVFEWNENHHNVNITFYLYYFWKLSHHAYCLPAWLKLLTHIIYSYASCASRWRIVMQSRDGTINFKNHHNRHEFLTSSSRSQIRLLFIYMFNVEDKCLNFICKLKIHKQQSNLENLNYFRSKNNHKLKYNSEIEKHNVHMFSHRLPPIFNVQCSAKC